MPLRLITGPVNSGKAAEVLDGVTEAAEAGKDPVLVVPTSTDSDLLRRELARRDVASAVRVTVFGGLWELIARRLEFDPRPLPPFRLQRVARAITDEALRAGDLDRLASSATSPGFAPALVSLAEDLGEVRASTEKFDLVMAAWGAAEPSRAKYASEIAALYRRYRERLLKIGARDQSSYVVELLDDLKSGPDRWPETPVFFYGFDDFGLKQLDTIRAISEDARAPVTISFPFEQRIAFNGRSWIYEQLLQLADGQLQVQPISTAHYAETSRAALGGFERGLFELSAPSVSPGDAIEAIVGGGERAEMELVAARIAALIEDGLSPDDIAVAIRDLDDAAPLVEKVFGANGISIAMRLRVQIDDTPLVRGMLALLECALCESPEDQLSTPLAASLVTWLRTPGAVKESYRGRVESLEKKILRGEITTLAEAEAFSPVGGLVAGLRSAFAEGCQQGCRKAADEARRLLAAAGGAGEAPVFDRQQIASIEALGDLIVGLDDLDWLVDRDASLEPTSKQLIDELAAREIEVGESLVAGAVSIALPLSLRARRAKTLVAARMQEGLYPQRGREDPFLDDSSRRRVDQAAIAAGLSPIWPNQPADRLEDERHLLHALLSRAEERLIYSYHRSNDRGEPANPTLFLDDIEELLDPPPVPLKRALGAVAWVSRDEQPKLAPSPYQRHLGEIAQLPSSVSNYDLVGEQALTALRSREVWSVTTLEAYLRCPMTWLIDKFLRPSRIEPDPGHFAYGTAIHGALEHLFEALPAKDRRITAANLPKALAALAGAVEELDPTSIDPVTDQVRRRQVFDAVASYLEHASVSGTEFIPDEFERSFGFDGQDPVDLGEGLLLSGKIDRVDRHGNQAIVIDYKSGKPSADFGAKKSVDQGLLQNALYSLAFEQQCSDAEVVAALYQTIRRVDVGAGRPRGALCADADQDRTDIVGGDRIGNEDFREMLAAARQAAIDAIAAIGEGKLEPTNPDRCSFSSSGGCAYPGICRRLS